MYNRAMSRHVSRVSEADAVSDFASLTERVRAGAEVIIENGHEPLVLHKAPAVRRTLAECIALLPKNSAATIDEVFAADVEAVLGSHREPVEPPAWD